MKNETLVLVFFLQTLLFSADIRGGGQISNQTGIIADNCPTHDVNIDYVIESATYRFLYTSCKTLENERVSAANE